MSLEKQISKEVLAAMKAKDQERLRGLRAIKSAIQMAKTEPGSSGELTEEQEIKLLQKLVKQRKESIAIYEAQNRTDLLEGEKAEVAVIETFLPEQMSEDELRAYVSKVIEETGASSMRDMGKVMGKANSELAGRADGKLLAQIVKAALS